MGWENRADFKELEGHIIVSIEGVYEDSGEVVIVTETNLFKMYHNQDCCEYVRLNDFEYSLYNDLIGATIISAEEVVSDADSGT